MWLLTSNIAAVFEPGTAAILLFCTNMHIAALKPQGKLYLKMKNMHIAAVVA